MMKRAACCGPRKRQPSTLTVDVDRQPSCTFLLIDVDHCTFLMVDVNQSCTFLLVDVNGTFHGQNGTFYDQLYGNLAENIWK